jgi:hypothetical protein
MSNMAANSLTSLSAGGCDTGVTRTPSFQTGKKTETVQAAAQAHVHSISVWKLLLILAGAPVGTRSGGSASYV